MPYTQRYSIPCTVYNWLTNIVNAKKVDMFGFCFGNMPGKKRELLNFKTLSGRIYAAKRVHIYINEWFDMTIEKKLSFLLEEVSEET